MAGSYTLPTRSSPFYGSTSGTEAAKALEELCERPEAFVKDVRNLVHGKSDPRRNMCFGALLISPGGKPRLGGYRSDQVTNVGSIAKLALLYAAFQLKADVGIIGCTPKLCDTGSAKEKERALVRAVKEAFTLSQESELRTLANASGLFPNLGRIFRLGPWLATPSGRRVPRNLAFLGALDVEASADGGTSLAESPRVVSNPSADDFPFDHRLRDAMHAENAAAASCIADIGLPYIQALLARTGFAAMHGPHPGLWLADFYGDPPRRAYDDYPAITSGGKGPVAMQATTPCLKATKTGQAGSVEGIATFLLLLARGSLVGPDDSRSMRDYLTRGGWVAGGLRGVGQGRVESKVGILEPCYSDAALIEATAMERAQPAGDGGTPAQEGGDAGSPGDGGSTGKPAQWIAVALLARGTGPNAGEALQTLGGDLEALTAELAGAG